MQPISEMTADERNFWEFWKQLPPKFKGVDPERVIVNPKFSNADIQMVPEKIDDDEVGLMVNLWWSTKMRLGLDTSFNMRQMDLSIADEGGDYDYLRELMDRLRVDMLHWPDSPHARAQKLRLRRIMPGKGQAAAGRSEGQRGSVVNRTKWALFLTDEHPGGRIYFPSRRVAIEPMAGAVVRWPMAFPWGLGPVSGRDPQFLLTGESSTEEGAKGEDWPSLSLMGVGS